MRKVHQGWVGVIVCVMLYGCGEAESNQSCKVAQLTRSLDPVGCIEPSSWLSVNSPQIGTEIRWGAEFTLRLNMNEESGAQSDSSRFFKEPEKYAWMGEYRLKVEEYEYYSTEVWITLKLEDEAILEEGREYVLSIKRPSTGEVEEYRYVGAAQ